MLAGDFPWTPAAGPARGANAGPAPPLFTVGLLRTRIAQIERVGTVGRQSLDGDNRSFVAWVRPDPTVSGWSRKTVLASGVPCWRVPLQFRTGSVDNPKGKTGQEFRCQSVMKKQSTTEAQMLSFDLGGRLLSRLNGIKPGSTPVRPGIELVLRFQPGGGPCLLQGRTGARSGMRHASVGGVAFAAGPFYNMPWADFSEAEAVECTALCRDHIDQALAVSGNSTPLEQALIGALSRRVPETPHRHTKRIRQLGRRLRRRHASGEYRFPRQPGCHGTVRRGHDVAHALADVGCQDRPAAGRR